MRIQDIAQEAKVSAATVSRVFSNNSNISSKTRDKVLKIARKYNYHPRLSAKRRNIVIITPSKVEFPNQNYTEMVLSELSRELSARDYRIEILPIDNVDRLHNIQFCGAIAIAIDNAIAKDWHDCFDAPLVMVDRELPKRSNGVFSVHSDEAQGMELAIKYLLEYGHRRIGCLIGSVEIGNPSIRQKSILEAIEKLGLDSDESLVRFARPEQFLEEVGKLLRLNVDSIFCPGGNGGIITAYALSLYGKKIPEDISLISSERTMVSNYCVPAQTTISQDYPALASNIVDVIDADLNGLRHSKEIVLPYKLIVRDSVKRRLLP